MLQLANTALSTAEKLQQRAAAAACGNVGHDHAKQPGVRPLLQLAHSSVIERENAAESSSNSSSRRAMLPQGQTAWSQTPLPGSATGTHTPPQPSTLPAALGLGQTGCWLHAASAGSAAPDHSALQG